MVEVVEYLSRIKRLNMMINNKLIELDELKNIATSFGSLTCDEKVISSKPEDKISIVVAKIVDMERDIEKMIDLYADEKKKIISMIDKIEKDEYYNVLSLKYIHSMSNREIANRMNYSTKQIKRIHTKAITEFYNMYHEEIDKYENMSANVL